MDYLPTMLDLANAAKYATYERRNALFTKNTLGLAMNISKRDYTKEDLNGVYDKDALGQILDAEWGEDCGKYNCSPFDVNGNLCMPWMNPQTWKTIDDVVHSGCQKSCYELLGAYDKDNPAPTAYPIRGDGTKCYLRDVAKETWAITPQIRAKSATNGLTNVPPFNVNDKTGAVSVPLSYCKWFGLSWDEETNECYRPWYQAVVEDYLIGSTMYRAFTIERGDPVGNNGFNTLINSEEYHLLYQRLANVVKKVKPDFVPYKRTQLLFDNIPIYNSTNNSRSLSVRQDDGNFDFDSVWDELNNNIILALLRDVLIDLGTEKLLSMISKIMTSFAQWLESAVPRVIEELLAVGGKVLLTSTLRATLASSTLKVLGNIIIKSATWLAETFATIASGIGIVQLVVGLAGLVLDLIDPLDLNSYLDSDSIDDVMKAFELQYLTTYHTSSVEILPVDLLALHDQNISNNDDIYLNALIASSTYLKQLEYNSIGQRLDWNADKPTGQVEPPKRTQTVNQALLTVLPEDVENYNRDYVEFIKTEQKMIPPLIIGATLFTAISICIILKTILVAIILVIIWLGYLLSYVARKSYLQTTMFNLSMMLAQRKT